MCSSSEYEIHAHRSEEDDQEDADDGHDHHQFDEGKAVDPFEGASGGVMNGVDGRFSSGQTIVSKDVWRGLPFVGRQGSLVVTAGTVVTSRTLGHTLVVADGYSYFPL